MSVWPARTMPPRPLPRVAIKLHLPGCAVIATISQTKPRSSSQVASAAQTPALVWSNALFEQLTDGSATRRASISCTEGADISGELQESNGGAAIFWASGMVKNHPCGAPIVAAPGHVPPVSAVEFIALQSD